MKGISVGSGIRVNYEQNKAKLEIYFQIPSEKQLEKLKITKFNDFHRSWFTQSIKGKNINKKTYRIFIKNLIKEFSYTDIDSVADFQFHSLIVTPYLGEDEEFLKNHKNAGNSLIKALNKYDESLKVPFVEIDVDSVDDWERYPECISESCPFYLILISNGYETSFVEDNENAFLQWTFNFDEVTNDLVYDVFNSVIHDSDIYYWIEPGTYYDQNWNHFVYSPFNLEKNLLHYNHSLTSIFEHQLDLKKIV